jgi:hypothetical protein
MAFLTSVGVNISEISQQLSVPTVGTTNAAIVGAFTWGPILDPISVTSESLLVQTFGKPTKSDIPVYSAFFSASNFLAYATNNILVCRVDSTSYKNASAGGYIKSVTVTNPGSLYNIAPLVTFAAPQTAGGTTATGTATLSAGSGATFDATESSGIYNPVAVNQAGSGYTVGDILVIPGTSLGGSSPTNDLTLTLTAVTGSGGVSTFSKAGTSTGSANQTNVAVGTYKHVVVSIKITNQGSGYTGAPAVTFDNSGTGGSSVAGAAVIQSLAAPKIKNTDDYLANFSGANTNDGVFAAKWAGTLGNTLKVSLADSATFSAWAYKSQFDSAPATSNDVSNRGGSNDEVHIVIIDNTGHWSGTPGTVIEKFAFLSKAKDGVKSDGTKNYWHDVINSSSVYVWAMDQPFVNQSDWGTTGKNTTFSSLNGSYTVTLIGGVDDFAPADGDYENGWDIFKSELFDISLLITARVTATVAAYVINNISSVRKDCVAFVSPFDTADGSVITASGSVGSGKITAFRNLLPSNSYAVMESGAKYQYDKYNDQFIYIPLNGDIAGLCAQTDQTNDPWWSPGGFNRGQIKNIVRLAYNPGQADRDTLYQSQINPVATFPGLGTVLYGDKTLLARPDAFGHINVRRLFIVLEKAIAVAAKFQLFEFNDDFTRAQFKATVEPFLRNVQGRRGITGFLVVCDASNNTDQIISTNQFVGDIYIKPNFAINFIQLNFINTPTGVQFSEVS